MPSDIGRNKRIARSIALAMRIAVASWRLVTQPDRIGCGAYCART